MINPFKHVEVNHFVFRHPSVTPLVSGMVIAHVTDIHFGRWVRQRHMVDLVAYVNHHAPDLVALTGDYVGYSARDIDRCIPPLADLEAPAFATLGNHDHWASTTRTHAAFDAIALPVLTNAAATFEASGGRNLQIIGVDDAVTRNHDIPLAFAEVLDAPFRLVLSHVPELAPRIAARGGDLILSGHTHGLQFNVPGARRLAARLGMRYIQGAYAFDDHDSLLYVSRGLGSASWPWRFRASPELAFFRLEHGARPELTLDHRVHTSLSGAPKIRHHTPSAGPPQPLDPDQEP